MKEEPKTEGQKDREREKKNELHDDINKIFKRLFAGHMTVAKSNNNVIIESKLENKHPAFECKI